MSQKPGFGPIALPGYPVPQGATAFSGPIMQPGHNMHPVSIQPPCPLHSLQYGHPHPAMNVGTPFPPGFPPTIPLPPPPALPMGLPFLPTEVIQKPPIISIVANWPMNGPMYPSSLASYLANQGPMPDINALQEQMAQANADIARGKYSLPNPSIADPRTIKSSWSDGIDISQTPRIVADPKIHGLPLPPPPPLPMMPPNPMSAAGFGHNGQWI